MLNFLPFFSPTKTHLVFLPTITTSEALELQRALKVGEKNPKFCAKSPWWISSNVPVNHHESPLITMNHHYIIIMNHHYIITMNHHEPPWFTNDFLSLKLAFLHLKTMMVGRRSFRIVFFSAYFQGRNCWISVFFATQPGCNRALLCKMSPTVTRCFTKKWTRDYFLGESFKKLAFSMIGRGIFPLTQERRLGFLKVQNLRVSLLEGYRSWEHWK